MLSIRQLYCGYKGVEVLHGVSLEIGPVECVALLGRNGAGKTTLLMAASGLVPCSGGQIEFDGLPILGLRPDKLIRMGIAHVPEGRRIFPELTVAENLAIGARLRRDRRPMRQDTDELLNMFPVLRERYRTPAGVLSGGEQQMLAIARGLISQPRLLLLDEPSLGLSPMVTEQIFSKLSEIKRSGTSVLLVEQNANQAIELADKVYILESGRVVLSGPADELMSDSRVIDAYLGAANLT
jgi:branched-chain amino acid transport system ATP-binding protein